jgi:uncharacterized protein (TIGR00290 family)
MTSFPTTTVRKPRAAALFWSGGKDSALALHSIRRSRPDIEVVKLATCVSQVYDRVSMHGIRRRLIEEQSDALGLPLQFVVIPSHDSPNCPMAHATPGTDFPPNDVYSLTILAALGKLKEDGIEVVVFGDIFLEDLRAYRDKLLGFAGLEGCYPLWQRDTAELYDEFITLGFQAVVVCVDTLRLPAEVCGRLLTPDFRASLPAGVDPCGERGEYHTFVFDGPLFRRPVAFTPAEVHRHEPFAFQELLPLEAAPHLARTVVAPVESPPANRLTDAH